MRLFVCFGGSAAVVDDDAAGGIEAAAAASARRRRHQRGSSSSFRGKFFLSGSRSKGTTRKPSSGPEPSPPAEEKERAGDADAAWGLHTASSSVPSSALLSSEASLDLDPCSATSRSSASASALVSGVFFPPPAPKREASSKGSSTSSPAAGAAAVVLCLLMVVFCGRVGATVLTSTALYLFPRRWPGRPTHKEGAVETMERDAEAEMTNREGGYGNTEGFLVMNRNS